MGEKKARSKSNSFFLQSKQYSETRESDFLSPQLSKTQSACPATYCIDKDQKEEWRLNTKESFCKQFSDYTQCRMFNEAVESELLRHKTIL